VTRAFLLAFALLAGCDARALPRGEDCELTSECETPLVCRLERCRIECRIDRDCSSGQRCVTEDGVGACTLPQEERCTLDSECPAPLVCRDRCVNECAAARDCVAGQRCEDGVCVSPPAIRCVSSRDCVDVGVCWEDGMCRPECEDDRDCGYGSRCATSEPRVCVLGDAGVTPGRDGGVDAGVLPPCAAACTTPSTSARQPTFVRLGLAFGCVVYATSPREIW